MANGRDNDSDHSGPSSLGSDLSALFAAASAAHELFRAFMVGGFTEQQALSLVATILAEKMKES